MFIYLDETGNFIGGNGSHFIVATFTVGDPARIHKAFRKWQRDKFPRVLKTQAEVKFNNPHLTDEVRLRTIRYLVNQDIRIFYTFLKIENIPEEYRKKGIVHETGLLYTEIVASTLELYFPITKEEFVVIRDQRGLKGVTLAQFNEKLKLRLLPLLPARTNLALHAVDSTSSSLIQVVDWVCGALARFYEQKPNGQLFYDMLKQNIVGEKELFRDYWVKQKKQ